MEIEALHEPFTSTLTYVVFDPRSRDAVVIDPVLDFDPLTSQTATRALERVAAVLEARGLRLHYVLETHAHADHLSGSQWLRTHRGGRVVIGERIREVQRTFQGIFDLPLEFRCDGSQFDRLLADGATLEAGTLHVRALATPGHTPACLSYLIEDAVFTGDALFLEDQGTGRCDFPSGSADDLYRSVHERLYALPGTTRVFPCHDYHPEQGGARAQTTIASSRTGNSQLRATTTRDEFVRFRTQRDATLEPPRLLYPSLLVNSNAGHLPAPHANGRRYLVIPLNASHPTLDDGTPIGP